MSTTTTTGVAFSDLPDDRRMGFRYALDAVKADVGQYHGVYVSVFVPCLPGSTAALDAIADRFGLVRDGDGWFFPLGSDRPADHLRWDGNYPGSKGFTLTYSYRPLTADEIKEVR